MLKDYPTKFNDTELFRPGKWETAYEKIATVKQSEAGTDMVLKTRAGKLRVSAEFNCTDLWLKKFREFDAMGSFTLSLYDVVVGGYSTHTVRIENLKANLEVHSDHITVSNGLYVVSFDIIEF